MALAVDIGSYSLKCVEITRRGKDTAELQQAFVLPIGRQTGADVSEMLRNFFRTNSFHSKTIRISIAGPSLLIRHIRMPILTPEELKGAMRFEAEGQIPFPIDDCILDFQILDKIPEKKLMNVLLVAAKRDFVQNRMKLAAETGMPAEVVDADIFCVANAYQALNGDNHEKVYGLLNVGHNVSSFAIILNKLPYFVRELPLGGLSVTQALSQLRSITVTEADELKINHSEESKRDLLTATQKGFEPLVEELKHSIDYFENETGEELKTIGLSGGGAMSHGAASFLTEELGREASLWGSGRKMALAQRVDSQMVSAHGPELGVAYGMALRGIGLGK